MDKLVRKIELPLAKKVISDAGLFLVPPEQIERVAEVAVDAYLDYPLLNWFMGGKYDPIISKKLLEITLKTMTQDAVIYADSEELNGVAVWIPLGFTGSKTIPFLMNGGLGLIARCGLGIIGRLLTYETYAMKLKEKYTGHVDWYLNNLFIAKKAQGKGLATKLLRPMLEFCNRENIVSYLETNKQGNVSLYEHFGFQVSEQGLIPKSDVMHYAMVRQPVPVGCSQVDA